MPPLGAGSTQSFWRKGRNQPRRSWLSRKVQEAAVEAEGLMGWQANPYYAAGRVVVPALLDTVACQAFIKKVSLKNTLM